MIKRITLGIFVRFEMKLKMCEKMITQERAITKL